MKFFIVSFLLVTYFFVAGQTSRGNWMAGGSGYFSSSRNKVQEGSRNVLFLSPNAGYFVRNNLAIGALLEYSYNNNYYYEVYAFNPFLRYYFLKMGDKAKLMMLAKGGLRFEKTNFPGDAYRTFDIGIGTGLSLFLNQHIAVEGIVSYTSYWNKNFSTSSIITFNIGFQYFLWSDKG